MHAIGAGVLLAEIQEMSDATFRIYDWGRAGPDGKPRQLHIREAMESIDFDRGPVGPIAPRVRANRRRRDTRAPVAIALFRPGASDAWSSRLSWETRERFTIVMGLKGTSDVEHGGKRVRLEFGQTLLLPAALGPVRDLTPRRSHGLDLCGSLNRTSGSQRVNDSRRRDRETGQSRGHREDDVPDEVSIPDRRSLTRLFPALRLVGAIRQAFDLRKLVDRRAWAWRPPTGLVAAGPAGSGGGRHARPTCSRHPHHGEQRIRARLLVLGAPFRDFISGSRSRSGCWPLPCSLSSSPAAAGGGCCMRSRA